MQKGCSRNMMEIRLMDEFHHACLLTILTTVKIVEVILVVVLLAAFKAILSGIGEGLELVSSVVELLEQELLGS